MLADDASDNDRGVISNYSHEADDSNNLDDGEDELGFTIALYAKHVDEYNDEEKDGDEDGPCEALIPVGYG